MDLVHFLLDCSNMGPAISAVQRGGEGVLYTLLKVSRNICHSLHNARVALLSTEYLFCIIATINA